MSDTRFTQHAIIWQNGQPHPARVWVVPPKELTLYQRYGELAEAVLHDRQARNEAIMQLWQHEDVTQRELGMLFGLTPVRIGQIVKEMNGWL